MLTLKLLGAAEARYGDRPLGGFPIQQPCLLLCYLALFRQRHALRDQLATVFWSDHDNSTARKQLRNCLWRLRVALRSIGARPSDYLATEGEQIYFRARGACELDVETFESTLAAYYPLAAGDLDRQQAARLEDALSLYTGDLLEGIYLDWCLSERERYYLAYLDALEKLMSYHGIQGHHERALDYGRQILSHDITREVVHRRMMWLHWATGDRCAAVAQYRLCAQVLHDEMGVEPLPRTTELYHRMLHARTEMGRIADLEVGQSGTLTLPGLPAQQAAALLLSRLEHLRETAGALQKELDSIARLAHQLLVEDGVPGRDSAQESTDAAERMACKGRDRAGPGRRSLDAD